MGEYLEHLRRASIFEGLDDEELEALESQMELRTVPAGEILFHKGALGNELYIILSGRVRIFLEDEDGSQTTFRHYGPGDLFGEFALLDEKPRSASADIAEDVTMLSLSQERLMALIRHRPAVGLRMMRSLAGRIRYTTNYLKTVVDSTKLLSARQYDEALENIEDSPSDDIHNLVITFRDMIEQVQHREKTLLEELEKKNTQATRMDKEQ